MENYYISINQMFWGLIAVVAIFGFFWVVGRGLAILFTGIKVLIKLCKDLIVDVYTKLKTK